MSFCRKQKQNSGAETDGLLIYDGAGMVDGFALVLKLSNCIRSSLEAESVFFVIVMFYVHIMLFFVLH